LAAYDVIVVGGGPAGSASACFFAERGQRVLVLDAARFPRRKACAEYVSPGGVAILERIGVLKRIHEQNSGRLLRGMRIRAPGGDCHLVEYGDRRKALSVSRLVLDAALLDKARECGAQVRENYRVRDVWITNKRAHGVIGPEGEQLEAELVVGADGLNSIVARAMGVRGRPVWPRRLGLVAHYSGVDWPEDYGWMLVGPRDYVGVAPLDNDGQVTVGLVRRMPITHLGATKAALEKSIASFPELEERLKQGHINGAVLGVGPMSKRVKVQVGPGYALVGDAAGFFDPFTGEGIFRALRGAQLLAANPETYAANRRNVFTAKERLVMLMQVFVQTPRLMNFVIHRLQRRSQLAHELADVLGDLQPARLNLVWRLLGP
jgi:geranylgeranyl reductase family protein